MLDLSCSMQTLSCGLSDLVPRAGIKPRAICLGSLESYPLVLNHFSRVQLSATLWIVANQAALSMDVFKQEDWKGVFRWDSYPLHNQGNPEN